MKKIVVHNFQDAYIGKRFSTRNEGLRSDYKVDEGVFIETNLNTDAKLDTLRAIVDFYGLEYEDIGFYLQANV